MAQKTKAASFTLIELLIVLIIIGVLVAFVISSIKGYVEKSKWVEAVATLGLIRKACIAYRTETEDYPNVPALYLTLNGPNRGKDAIDGSNNLSSFVDQLGLHLPDIKSDGRFGYALVSADYLDPNSPNGAPGYFPCAFAWIDNNPRNNLYDGGQEQYITISYDGKLYSEHGEGYPTAPHFSK